MTTIAKDAAERARRVAERELQKKLDLYRMRGRAARAARQDRQMPALPSRTPDAQRPLIEASWLQGYDEARELRQADREVAAISRKNSRTAEDAFAKYLQRLDNPMSG